MTGAPFAIVWATAIARASFATTRSKARSPTRRSTSRIAGADSSTAS